MHRRILMLFAVLALATGLVYGCGDDEDEGSDEPVVEETTTEDTDTDTEDTETTETDGEALTDAEYAQAAQDIFLTLGEEAQGLGAVGADNIEDAADVLAEIETKLNEAIDEFDAITPPEEFTELHDGLVDGLRTFSGSVGSAVDAAESGDEQALLDAVADVQQAALDFQEEATALQQEVGTP